MKRLWFPAALLLMLSLCACSREPAQTPADTPSEIPQEQSQAPSHEHITAEGTVVPEARTPVYVTLPDDSDGSDHLVFYGRTEDGAALYEDVSGLTNAIALPSVCGNLGDTMTTQLRLCGQPALCAFDLKITYDKNRLKFVGSHNEDDDLMVHCDEETGVIRMNFLRVANLKKPFVFCDLRFQVLTAEICDSLLDIEVVEAVSIDGSGEIVFCDYAVVDGMAWLNQKEVDD